MADQHESEIKLFTQNAVNQLLSEAVKEFIKASGENPPQTFALLYSPKKCYLAKLLGNEFYNKHGKIEDGAIFEARVFNDTAEMRWLNEANGYGATAVLTEDANFDFFGKVVEQEKVFGSINQSYLIWGERVKDVESSNDWTQFATARIGAFWIPIESSYRAQFTAVEYLKTYEYGNVAVFDERLTGISTVKKGEAK